MSHAQFEIDVDVEPAFGDAVDADLLVEAAVKTLESEGVTGAGMSIVLADDATVHELNRRYRDVDAPTDVLSFPVRETTADDPVLHDLPAELTAELSASLGDLIIALPYTRAQAARYGASLDAELRLLVVHGTLHLLGYDHGTAAEERAMWAAQDRVLAHFGQRTPDQRDYD